jgi:signal transduction histidine kinase
VERFIYTGIDEAQARQLGTPPVGRGLLGALARYDTPLRLDDITIDSRFTGWPAGHPDMSVFLGVPIRAGGQTVGSLYMTRVRGRAAFTAEDELAAVMLALQVAVAVSAAISRERTSRVAVLEERVGIAHDLHDGLIQSLYALGLEWQVLADDQALTAEALREAMTASIGRVNEVIADIRGYIEALEADVPRTTPVLDLDLAHTVQRLVPQGVDVVLRVSAPALQELSARESEDLLFIAREAVSNAVRHGSPTKIAVDVRQTDSEIALTVQDNGIGFDEFAVRTGFGTITMRTRAARLGADLTVLSVQGMGTTVRVALPRVAP